MTPFLIVIALMHMPYEPITSSEDWYTPKIEIIQTEPSIEDIENEINRRRYRIMELQECDE